MDRPAGRQGGRAEGPEEERRGVVARLSVGCRRRLEQKLTFCRGPVCSTLEVIGTLGPFLPLPRRN